MKPALLAASLIALGASASLARDAFAARTLVATVPSGVTAANYAVSTSDGGILVVASGSANVLSLVDGRSFASVATTLSLSSGGIGVRSLTIGLDSTTEVAAGTANGKVEQFSVASLFAVLHATLALRVLGSFAGEDSWLLRIGAWGNAAAVALFIVTAATLVLGGGTGNPGHR